MPRVFWRICTDRYTSVASTVRLIEVAGEPPLLGIRVVELRWRPGDKHFAGVQKRRRWEFARVEHRARVGPRLRHEIEALGRIRSYTEQRYKDGDQRTH